MKIPAMTPRFRRIAGNAEWPEAAGAIRATLRGLAMHVTAAALLCCTAAASADIPDPPDEAGVDFFEKKIRPVLVQHCYKCHAADAKEVKSELLLDTREGMRRGGEMGHAVVPGSIDESLIISALEYEDLEMPPRGQLPDAVIADFRRWIEMGAPDPRDGGPAPLARRDIDIQQGREFWAFQPVTSVEPPAVKDKTWPKNEIDRFVLAALEQASLQPVGDAARTTWIRRVYFDLIGLPPSPDEIKAFLQDESPQARETVVDRLLGSPQFGQRWGRHWLDVARYAESVGRTRNYPFPFAWRYRDYVIRSFNDDKPYDRFVTEQIAGDLLPAETPEARAEQLTATGFLALGAHDLNERDKRIFAMDVVGEQLDVVGRGVMGLTLVCARCHDHKFDPLPTRDYYALAGIFGSTELLNGYANRQGGGNNLQVNRLYALSPAAGKPAKGPSEPEQAQRPNNKQAGKADQEIAALQDEIKQLRRQQKKTAKNGSLSAEQRRARTKELGQQLAKAQAQFGRLKRLQKKPNKRKGGAPAPSGPHAMGVGEAAEISNCRINIRGDAHQLGEAVPRGFPQVLDLPGTPTIPADQSGRRDLAEWLTREDHPLTARVMVNRIWHHLIGRGIVGTVDNFGQMGERPTHPELLDYLASRFVREGWSVKKMIRLVTLSHTYALSSESNARGIEVDPENRLLWRMNRRRLEAEAIRDAILLVGGSLDLTPPQGSSVAQMGIGEVGRQMRTPQYAGEARRTVYLPILRSFVPEMLVTFDFPEPSDVKGRREVTTVAPQSLYLMNNPLVRDQAAAAAQRLVETVQDDVQRVTVAYHQTLSRPPGKEEVQRILGYVAELRAEQPDGAKQTEQLAWARVYHALMATAEFRYRY